MTVVTTAALSAGLAQAPAQAELPDRGALEALFGEPVTTSATGQPQRVSDTPVNMVIITADDIRRSGARDLPGVLRHVGGVDVLEWTAAHTDLSIRGYDREFASRVLVLVDGRQVYADYFGFAPWHALPVELNEIRQIEVVKGPNSALFGFNAVGGVINIITYDPHEDAVDAAAITVGTQGLVQGSAIATLQSPDGSAGLRITLGGADGDEYSSAEPAAFGASRSPDTADRASIGLDGDFQATDKVHFRLSGHYTEASRNEVAPAFSLTHTDYVSHSVYARLMVDSRYGLIEASAYANRIAADTAPTDVLDSFRFDNRVSVFQLQDLISLGAEHTLRAAVEYRHNDVNTTPVSGGDISYDVLSASGMWSWAITQKVALTNAMRLDRLELGRDGDSPAGYPYVNADWDRSIEEISFNSGFVWRATDRDSIRLMVARGVQLPNLTYLGSVVITTPFFNVTGTPNIDPSVVNNIEVTWDRELDWIDADARIALFHQETEGETATEGGAEFTFAGYWRTPANIGESSATGIEIGLKGAFDGGWRWSADYRAEVIDDDFVTAPGSVSTNYEDTTPVHLVNASLGWSGGRWEADGYARYQSDTMGFRPQGGGGYALTPIDAYLALDGRIAYALTPRASIALSGQNLGADEQVQTSGPAVERRILTTLTVRR